MYLPDISETLDQKKRYVRGVVAATEYSGGSPLVTTMGFPFIVLGIQIGKFMRKSRKSRDFVEQCDYIHLFNVSVSYISTVSAFS